jgi:3',5'-cyclic AMP phosphodiesterase CpdA
VAARVLHVSDLHVGRRETPEALAALGDLAARIEPELLLVTGDLSHRGRREQLEQASSQLERLGVLSMLVVPGNHDIPYTFPARFTRTYVDWQRVFGTPEPVYSSERLHVVGASSVRPWRQQSGALSEAKLARIESFLRAAPAGALRVVALHHHLAAPPWRAARKRPLKDRDRVLERLAGAGAELVAAGHVHQGGIAERREFEALEDGGTGSVVLATVPGLGRPRPRRRGEARGVNVYEADAASLTVTTFAWDGAAFGETGRRAFPRG